MENLKLLDVDYCKVRGLSLEDREKLEQVSPRSLGQASRISGVSSTALQALFIYVKKKEAGAFSVGKKARTLKMSANTLGHIFKFHSFGESHGPAMGIVVEGCPAGLSVSLKVLEKELERRRPGKWSWTSSRKEPDKFEILSGVFQGKTLGTPIALVVYNRDQKSQDYNLIKKQARPGHSEDLWKAKFGHYDYRGGREVLWAGDFGPGAGWGFCPDAG